VAGDDPAGQICFAQTAQQNVPADPAPPPPPRPQAYQWLLSLRPCGSPMARPPLMVA